MKDFLYVSIASLLIYFCSQSLFAATSEQNYASREPQRKEYAAAMQKTHEMLDRSIAAASSNGSVTQTGSASSTVSDGSKVSGSGSVTKPISGKDVGKTITDRLGKAKALGKATLPSFLGSAALSALLSAVGWVMDEGGKVTKPHDTSGDCGNGSSCSSSSSLYQLGTGEKFSTGQAACDYFLKKNDKTFGTVLPTIRYKNDLCTLHGGSNKYSGNVAANANKIQNPHYDSSAPSPQPQNVPDDELAEKINNYVTNNSTTNITNNIVNNAYSYDNSNGQTASDPTNSLATAASNDIAKEMTNAATSNNGTSTTTSNGKTVIAAIDPDSTGNITQNPTDPNNPTSPQSSSLTLPAFCSWASIVCDWYVSWKESDKVYKDHIEKTEEHQTSEKSFWQTVKDWFTWSRDDSDLPEKDDSELDVTTPFEEKKKDISWAAECPAPLYETVSFHGYTTQLKVQDYSFLCSIDWIIKPFTIGLASVLSIFIIFGFNRGSED